MDRWSLAVHSTMDGQTAKYFTFYPFYLVLIFGSVGFYDRAPTKNASVSIASCTTLFSFLEVEVNFYSHHGASRGGIVGVVAVIQLADDMGDEKEFVNLIAYVAVVYEETIIVDTEWSSRSMIPLGDV